MAQDYKLAHFEAGDFTDPHGNVWCDAHLEGVGPVKMVVKDPSKYSAGMTVYGTVEDQTSKAGKSYKRFKREQKPDGNYSGGQQSFGGDTPASKPAYKDNSDGQRQGMCFNNAASFINHIADSSIKSTPEAWAKSVWTYANALYRLGDLGGSESISPKASNNPGGQTDTMISLSGYDKFKAKEAEVKAKVADNKVPTMSAEEWDSIGAYQHIAEAEQGEQMPPDWLQ